MVQLTFFKIEHFIPEEKDHSALMIFEDINLDVKLLSGIINLYLKKISTDVAIKIEWSLFEGLEHVFFFQKDFQLTEDSCFYRQIDIIIQIDHCIQYMNIAVALGNVEVADEMHSKTRDLLAQLQQEKKNEENLKKINDENLQQIQIQKLQLNDKNNTQEPINPSP